MKLAKHGIEADIPDKWDGRIFRNDGGPQGDPTAPAFQAANFPLPSDTSEYGGVATSLMKSGNVFVALVEFIPDENLKPGAGLFEPRGFPSDISLADFDPNVLAQNLPGQVGLQRFFTIGRRPFSLYVVLGDSRGPLPVVDQARDVVKSVDVDPSYDPATAA